MQCPLCTFQSPATDFYCAQCLRDQVLHMKQRITQTKQKSRELTNKLNCWFDAKECAQTGIPLRVLREGKRKDVERLEEMCLVLQKNIRKRESRLAQLQSLRDYTHSTVFSARSEVYYNHFTLSDPLETAVIARNTSANRKKDRLNAKHRQAVHTLQRMFRLSKNEIVGLSWVPQSLEHLKGVMDMVQHFLLVLSMYDLDSSLLLNTFVSSSAEKVDTVSDQLVLLLQILLSRLPLPILESLEDVVNPVKLLWTCVSQQYGDQDSGPAGECHKLQVQLKESLDNESSVESLTNAYNSPPSRSGGTSVGPPIPEEPTVNAFVDEEITVQDNSSIKQSESVGLDPLVPSHPTRDSTLLPLQEIPSSLLKSLIHHLQVLPRGVTTQGEHKTLSETADEIRNYVVIEQEIGVDQKLRCGSEDSDGENGWLVVDRL